MDGMIIDPPSTATRIAQFKESHLQLMSKSPRSKRKSDDESETNGSKNFKTKSNRSTSKSIRNECLNFAQTRNPTRSGRWQHSSWVFLNAHYSPCAVGTIYCHGHNTRITRKSADAGLEHSPCPAETRASTPTTRPYAPLFTLYYIFL
jgi:hypothetical protein